MYCPTFGQTPPSCRKPRAPRKAKTLEGARSNHRTTNRKGSNCMSRNFVEPCNSPVFKEVIILPNIPQKSVTWLSQWLICLCQLPSHELLTSHHSTCISHLGTAWHPLRKAFWLPRCFACISTRPRPWHVNARHKSKSIITSTDSAHLIFAVISGIHLRSEHTATTHVAVGRKGVWQTVQCPTLLTQNEVPFGTVQRASHG